MKLQKYYSAFLILFFIFSQPTLWAQDFNFPGDFQLPPNLNKKISGVEFINKPVKEAIVEIFKGSKINVLLDDDISGRYTASFNDSSLQDVLNSFLFDNNLRCTLNLNTLRLFPAYKAPLNRQVFNFLNVSASQILPIISRMLTPNRGTVEVDSRLNALLVTDTDDTIFAIRCLLPQIDLKDNPNFISPDSNVKMVNCSQRINFGDVKNFPVEFSLEIAPGNASASIFNVTVKKKTKTGVGLLKSYEISLPGSSKTPIGMDVNLYCFPDSVPMGDPCKIKEIK